MASTIHGKDGGGVGWGGWVVRDGCGGGGGRSGLILDCSESEVKSTGR